MNKNESKYFNTAIRMDEALITLLEKKDFEYITITEICKVAAVNRSTFYLHYENTSDLLAETTRYILDKHWAYYSTDTTGVAECFANCNLQDLLFRFLSFRRKPVLQSCGVAGCHGWGNLPIIAHSFAFRMFHSLRSHCQCLSGFYELWGIESHGSLKAWQHFGFLFLLA